MTTLFFYLTIICAIVLIVQSTTVKRLNKQLEEAKGQIKLNHLIKRNYDIRRIK